MSSLARNQSENTWFIWFNQLVIISVLPQNQVYPELCLLAQVKYFRIDLWGDRLARNVLVA